jgi:hypothetical protein
MSDRYRTKDGWSVEIVRLECTPDHHDGEWLRVCYFGYHVRDVRSVSELERYFPLAGLEPEALTGVSIGTPAPCAQPAGTRSRSGTGAARKSGSAKASLVLATSMRLQALTNARRSSSLPPHPVTMALTTSSLGRASPFMALCMVE